MQERREIEADDVATIIGASLDQLEGIANLAIEIVRERGEGSLDIAELTDLASIYSMIAQGHLQQQKVEQLTRIADALYRTQKDGTVKSVADYASASIYD